MKRDKIIIVVLSILLVLVILRLYKVTSNENDNSQQTTVQYPVEKPDEDLKVKQRDTIWVAIPVGIRNRDGIDFTRELLVEELQSNGCPTTCVDNVMYCNCHHEPCNYVSWACGSCYDFEGEGTVQIVDALEVNTEEDVLLAVVEFTPKLN